MNRRRERGGADEPSPRGKGGAGGNSGSEARRNKEPGNPARTVIPSDRYDLRVMQALRRIMRATDLYSRRLATDYQLTVPQLICLHALLQEQPLNATSIAKRIHLSASTVVGILDRLEMKGLVKRERDSEDRRVVNVTVSEKGREVALKAPSPLEDRFSSVFERLPETEQEGIARSLQRIVDLIEAQDLDAAPMLVPGQSNLKERDN